MPIDKMRVVILTQKRNAYFKSATSMCGGIIHAIRMHNILSQDYLYLGILTDLHFRSSSSWLFEADYSQQRLFIVYKFSRFNSGNRALLLEIII